jgi:hypothetical protein
MFGMPVYSPDAAPGAAKTAPNSHVLSLLWPGFCRSVSGITNSHRRLRLVAIQAEFAYPGVRRDSYDSIISEVEAKLRLAMGFIAHSAAETEDGFRVVEVWESEAAMLPWLQDTIAPMMASAGGAASEPTASPDREVAPCAAGATHQCSAPRSP